MQREPHDAGDPTTSVFGLLFYVCPTISRNNSLSFSSCSFPYPVWSDSLLVNPVLTSLFCNLVTWVKTRGVVPMACILWYFGRVVLVWSDYTITAHGRPFHPLLPIQQILSSCFAFIVSNDLCFVTLLRECKLRVAQGVCILWYFGRLVPVWGRFSQPRPTEDPSVVCCPYNKGGSSVLISFPRMISLIWFVSLFCFVTTFLISVLPMSLLFPLIGFAMNAWASPNLISFQMMSR